MIIQVHVEMIDVHLESACVPLGEVSTKTAIHRINHCGSMCVCLCVCEKRGVFEKMRYMKVNASVFGLK